MLVGQSLGGNPGLISQPDTLQRLRGRGDRGGISEAGAVGSNDDIVQQRQAGEAADHLEGTADAQAADLVDFLAEHGFAVERRGALGCGEDAAEHIEQCGFAGAVGADDAEDLARVDLETDPADRAQAAERFGQILRRSAAWCPAAASAG